MVMENICFSLNQFIHCSAYEKLDTEKIDVSLMTPEQTANAIVKCGFDCG